MCLQIAMCHFKWWENLTSNYGNCPQIHGLSLQASGQRQVPTSFLTPPYERTLPQGRKYWCWREANADRFQRLWVLSHETEEDTKVMTIVEKCKCSLTLINDWLNSGIWSFTKEIRSARLFCQILQGNFFSLLSYSFSSACCRELNC